MEQISEFFGKISELIRTRPELEETKNCYGLPFPEGTKVRGIVEEGPEHKGPYRGAVDFLVDNGTPVLAPLSGKVVEVVDFYDQYGPGRKYRGYLNYITISHNNGEEFSQFAHMAPMSARVQKGDFVNEGEVLAITGNSGRMTEPHLHVLFFKLFKDNEGKQRFRGLKPRFKTAIPISK